MQSYPPQRASASGGTSKLRHTRWRDTLAPDPNPGVQSAALLPPSTVCRFSSQQWQAVRRVFWRSILVGDGG